MLKAFAYRIYPTKPQLKDLEEHLNRTRELYNAALQERRDAYKKAGKTVTAFEQMRSLALVKEGRPEYRRIHAHVLQGVITQLNRLKCLVQCFVRSTAPVRRWAGLAPGRER